MIRVTPAAATRLHQLVPPDQKRLGRAIRLVADRRGGLSMGTGLASPGDLVAADDHGPVLILAAALAGPLDGLVFDWVGDGLTFRPAAADEPDDLLVLAPSRRRRRPRLRTLAPSSCQAWGAARSGTRAGPGSSRSHAPRRAPGFTNGLGASRCRRDAALRPARPSVPDAGTYLEIREWERQHGRREHPSPSPRAGRRPVRPRPGGARRARLLAARRRRPPPGPDASPLARSTATPAWTPMVLHQPPAPSSAGPTRRPAQRRGAGRGARRAPAPGLAARPADAARLPGEGLRDDWRRVA